MKNPQFAESLEMLTKVSAGNEVIFAELGSEISLLSIKSGVYFTLNAVGASVWRQIHEPITLAEIKRRLLEEYDVDEARCEGDLIRIIENLRSHGLIEISPP